MGLSFREHGTRPLHVNPFHVKNAKELDDNDPSKNDRKDPKGIAGLVNEGRFSYPYIPEGCMRDPCTGDPPLADSGRSNPDKEPDGALVQHPFPPEYKDVYRAWDAASGLMILRVAPLPEDIIKLGMDGITRSGESKLRACGLKRAAALVNAAERSVGVKMAPEAGRGEPAVLLEDYERLEQPPEGS